MSELVQIKNKTNQKLMSNGKIYIERKGWLIRIFALIGIFFTMFYTSYLGIELKQPLILFSVILPLHSFLILLVGWFFYKNPAHGGLTDNVLISVIVPVYNQQDMIDIVFDAIFRSSYNNIEVIAINDGSTDNSLEELKKVGKKYPRLTILNKKNEGKRKAIADGFKISKGNYFVLIDSDSIIDKYAIEEFDKAFARDNKVGSLVGHAKVWNAEKNILTKFQDVWYDYFFNIRKTTESTFGTVLCCSGCLAAYRREALAPFIPFWEKSKIHYGDDRELTSYVIAPKWAKSEIENLYVNKNGTSIPALTKKTMKAMSEYDDAEDRALTAQSLFNWTSKYVASSVVYTDVPEKWNIFVKQQKRWKKGTTRVNFFVSTFFWKRNPLISLIFYLDFMSMFSTPLIMVTLFVYVPIVLQDWTLPLVYLLGIILPGLAHGSDYKFRDTKSKNWKFKPCMDLVTTFVTSWLIFPAIWSFKKNEWLTR